MKLELGTLAGLLTVLFVILKAFGKISWSWWWVFSPLWICGIIIVIILLFIAAVAIALSYK